MSKVVKYSTGMPTENGMYAVRVRNDNDDGIMLWCDKFLVFVNGRWGYPSSDLYYRGEVKYWIGPLQRMMEK